MTPCIWTAIYMEAPPEALRRLRACGWECFELSTEHLNMIDEAADQPALIDEVRATLDELGASMPQAHCHLMADVADPDEARRAADIARVEREMSICAKLGVRDVVLHPGRGTGAPEGEEQGALKAMNAEAFGRLGGLAEELGLRIGIENMVRSFGATAPDLLGLIEAAGGGDALGVTLDTSHAHLQGLDIPAAIRELGARLICTHISDNDGSGDQHRTPGTGTIDWPPVMAALAEVGYDGLLNLEIPGERHPVPAMLELKLRHARAVAGMLVEMAAV